ncbi:MAG: 4Fe-4S cluster-binding domain-containing protein [Acidobacteriota bacterium]|nr:4Fe-4S cluster-binding domain-containing protein [Acidobacteriota bacterium]
MPLTGVHFLLSYQCTHECDHCFVWSSPRAGGTMCLEMLNNVLDQGGELGTVNEVYFEGGEPFLFYPVLVEGIRQARERGFSTGVVTNCYWATAEADAALWLEPLCDLDVADLSISSDTFHAGEEEDPRPAFAAKAARELGLAEAVITIDPPAVCAAPDEKGLPIVGGSVRFRGRAAVKLTADLPRRPWTDFDECPDEDFLDPGRVHVDGYGNVHLCQGLLVGNVEKTSLGEMFEAYDPSQHPVIGPLVAGGPAELVRVYDLPHEDGYVDACHLCYEARAALRDRFPEILGPPHLYGEDK